MSYSIVPINTGFILVNGGYVTFGGDSQNKVEIPATAWLVTDGKENILVDTGMCDTQRAHEWHHPGSYQPEGFKIEERL